MNRRSDRTCASANPFLASPIVLILLAGAALADGPVVDGEFLARLGVRYRLLERKEPRPLRIHALQVDLARAEIELASVVAADPDGDGPADAALEPPEDMARRTEAIAFINANPWQSVPDAQGKRTTDWRKGLPVEILGLAVTAGAARTRMPEHGCAFWLDGKGRPRIGQPAKGERAVEAVSGFSQVLKDGEVVAGPDPALHPRSALGLDREGRTLFLAVIDGRQPGFSEGMTIREVGALLKELGAADGINLDGGGSSILILADKDLARRVVNDPSTKILGKSVARPLPDGLVLRRRRPAVPAGSPGGEKPAK